MLCSTLARFCYWVDIQKWTDHVWYWTKLIQNCLRIIVLQAILGLEVFSPTSGLKSRWQEVALFVQIVLGLRDYWQVPADDNLLVWHVTSADGR